MKDLISILTFVTALGCGLVAGIFFAFSNFVMKALARVPPAQGVATMQSINVVVLNRWFFVVFLGTAFCCFALAVISLVRWQRPGHWLSDRRQSALSHRDDPGDNRM